jgi:kynurenine formamidase
MAMAILLLLIIAINSVQASTDNHICHAPVHGGHGTTRSGVIDITHAYRADVPKWMSESGLGKLTGLVQSMADGDVCNVSELKLEVHSGTHVDAPGHYVQEHYEAGLDVASLSLDVLIGPVLLIDAPRDSNLTAQVLQNLHIPPGVERVIFRTLNSDRKLMWSKEWDSSYVGFTTDGADWLVKNTNVKFVGIDYLSIAAYVDIVAAHRILLGKKLVIVEGLNLDEVEMGLYTVHCLPLKLLQAEGCPIRCVLST